MIWEAWLSLSIALGLLVSVAARLASTDVLALAGLAILIVVQNLTGSTHLPETSTAVAGFGNEGLITIALLFQIK